MAIHLSQLAVWFCTWLKLLLQSSWGSLGYLCPHPLLFHPSYPRFSWGLIQIQVTLLWEETSIPGSCMFKANSSQMETFSSHFPQIKGLEIWALSLVSLLPLFFVLAVLNKRQAWWASSAVHGWERFQVQVLALNLCCRSTLCVYCSEQKVVRTSELRSRCDFYTAA